MSSRMQLRDLALEEKKGSHPMVALGKERINALIYNKV